MADNTTINAGSGGDTLRTDDIGGGVKVPVSKLITGADGVDGGFVSTSNPLPTQIQSGSISGLLVGGVAVSNANGVPITDAGSSLTVDGAVTVSSGSVTGLLVGGVALSQANPIPSQVLSGSVTGLLVGGVAVSNANGVPITDAGSSLTVDGSVTVLSGSVTGLLVGGVAASLGNPVPTYSPTEASSQILSGTVIVGVYHAFGDYSTSGSANQIIAPLGAGKRIAVLAMEVMCLSSTNVRFVSTGSAGTITNISNKMYLPANGGVVLPHNQHAWFKTAANEGLNIDLSAANTVGVTLTWTVFNNP